MSFNRYRPYVLILIPPHTHRLQSPFRVLTSYYPSPVCVLSSTTHHNHLPHHSGIMPVEACRLPRFIDRLPAPFYDLFCSLHEQYGKPNADMISTNPPPSLLRDNKPGLSSFRSIPKAVYFITYALLERSKTKQQRWYKYYQLYIDSYNPYYEINTGATDCQYLIHTFVKVSNASLYVMIVPRHNHLCCILTIISSDFLLSVFARVYLNTTTTTYCISACYGLQWSCTTRKRLSTRQS